MKLWISRTLRRVDGSVLKPKHVKRNLRVLQAKLLRHARIEGFRAPRMSDMPASQAGAAARAGGLDGRALPGAVIGPMGLNG